MQLPNIGSYWRQVLTLVSGTTTARLISLAALPVLTRLYLPEAFGLAAVFFASVTVLAVVINGGYEMAVMLPESDGEARALVRLCLRLALGLSIFLMIPAWLARNWLAMDTELATLSGWQFLVPLSLLMEGIIQPLQVALNRRRKYRPIAVARVIRATVTVVVSIALGIKNGHFGGLIIGFVLGQGAGAAAFGWSYWRQIGRFAAPETFGDLAGSYADFPRYAVLSNWLHTASRYLPMYLLPIWFTAELNGQFSQADRILALPVTLVAMSIGGVFYERANRAAKIGLPQLAKVTKSNFLNLFTLGLPFLVVILIFGPQLFSWVLGANWEQAGYIARWLMPWMFLAFIASPLSYLIDVRRKLGIFLVYNFGLFIARLVALWWAYQHLDGEGTIKLYALVSAVLVGLQLIYLLYLGGFFRGKESA